MAEKLTDQQKQAVEDRGGRLLVSASAGSGKTKVLVDRLLKYISDGNGEINIDDFLIITYTKAAAAELRGKIAAKLNERLAEDPYNKHMQRQLQRLYMAKISTVHSFCGDVLREYAYKLDIPADFRIAEEKECSILQLQVLDKLLDEAYEEADPDFFRFIDMQVLGRDDSVIPSIILQVYNKSRCHVDPDQWLDKCISSTEIDGINDASQTAWGEYLIDQFHSFLDMQIVALTRCAELAEADGTMPKPAALLRDNVYMLEALRNKTSWDDIVNHGKIDFGTLRFPSNCEDTELIGRIKSIRDAMKKALIKQQGAFVDSSEQVLKDLQGCAAAIKGLVRIVRRFAKEYSAFKLSRHIMDFSDLEHIMLDLLYDKQRIHQTSLANEIGDRFCEIMVDEYQDSNEVQDGIFMALTEKRKNCFMVGDVKQSIYQFRLADPRIFLTKYDSYVPAEHAKPNEGRKVVLSNNFRSAKPVLEAVNDVCSCCMSPEVGGLYYRQDEMLIKGGPIPDDIAPKVEFCMIDGQGHAYDAEAEYVARRIHEMLTGNQTVIGRNGPRPVVADDIVILLRAPGSSGASFQYALEAKGIRVNSSAGMDLLQTQEISFLRSMLQIIDNPLQDIPLISALTSRILCFTADELSLIRAGKKSRTFYDALKVSELPKVKEFLTMLSELREEARLCSLSQLIQKILTVTRMESIMGSFSDGNVRNANIQAFCQLAHSCEASNQRELGQFLDYLTAMDEKGISVNDDKKVPGAVTITSIHKSKGLEYPIVFLCGLSRSFNFEDAYAQILCDKKLGIGMNCIDLVNRVRYPSIAKKAISNKIIQDTVSEELRVLYVAMTRAESKMIMTYATNKPADEIKDMVDMIDICDSREITSGARCPGTWVLYTVLQRVEAGELFALGGRPKKLLVSDNPWQISLASGILDQEEAAVVVEDTIQPTDDLDIDRLNKSLVFVYPHKAATVYPSKQTATQLKGRAKDQEAAENTKSYHNIHTWRRASFDPDAKITPVTFGNAMHAVMQYIRFDQCTDPEKIRDELYRIEGLGLMTTDMVASVDAEMICRFFRTELGQRLITASDVIREFKFSILDDASVYDGDIQDDQILLQGVVDCAIVEADGITVVDFKTDRVDDESVTGVAESYRLQVTSYARALSRIYGLPIKSAVLYFFRTNTFVTIL